MAREKGSVRGLENKATIPFRPFSQVMLLIGVISVVSIKNGPYALLELIGNFFFIIASVLGLSKKPGRKTFIAECAFYFCGAVCLFSFSFISRRSVVSGVAILCVLGIALCLAKLRRQPACENDDSQTNDYNAKLSGNSSVYIYQNPQTTAETKVYSKSHGKFALFSGKEKARKDAVIILDSVNKCAETVNHTNDSKAYFTALGQLIDGLLKLSDYEKFGFYRRGTPSEDLREILKPENLQSNTDKFITRSMIRCAKEISEKRTEDEKKAHYRQFAENLYQAFKNANSYWNGNGNSPHYTGQLFTDENVKKVQGLCDDEDSGYRAVIALTPETPPDNPYTFLNSYSDELLPAAVDVVLKTGQASTSILQRRLKLGYSRASRLIDEMERNGYVGSFEGSAPRRILISREQWEKIRNAVHYKSPAPSIDTAQIIRDEENWRRARMGLSPIEYELQKVDGMEGHTFEEWCADLLRRNGFSSVEVTPGSGDQGVDITAEKDGLKYAVQCKRYASDLGNTPIQEVVAGKAFYRCNVAAVMTNQHFTSGAKELASINGVLLWDRESIIDMLKQEKSEII